MPASEHRLAALDGLRGLAALAVVVGHFDNWTKGFHLLLGRGSGQLAVCLFFVLSGFLMGWLYRERPFSKDHVIDFARRRFARIAPLFLFALLLSFALTFTPFSSVAVNAMSPAEFFKALFLWEGPGIFWTVPVEVQFYAVFPLIWLASDRLGRLWLPLTMAAGILLLLATKARYPVLLDSGAPFLLGVIIAAMPMRPVPRLANMVFVVCLIAFFLFFPGLWRVVGLKPISPYHSPIHMLVIGGLIWAAVRSPLAGAVFGGHVGRFVGGISFSVYLLHPMVFRTLKLTPLNEVAIPLYFVLFLGLTLAVASLSYRYFEVPTRRWITGATRPPRVPATAVGDAAG